MGKFIDMAGRTYGMLTILYLAELRGNEHMWRVRCECGVEKTMRGEPIRHRQNPSCGCRRGRVGSKGNNAVHGHTKGRTSSPTFRSWAMMKGRVLNPNATGHAFYKDISICIRWVNGDGTKGGFECFLEDMGERPDGKTLDRWPNNKGNYEPGNCRWATRKEQQNNLKNNRYFEYNGEKITVNELSRRTGIPLERLRHRLHRAGWSVQDALADGKFQGQRDFHE